MDIRIDGGYADRLDIVDTVVAYATAVDTRDWELFARLFTPDAVWEYHAGHERRVGPGEILARVRPSIERLDVTQHLLTNHVVAVAGDAATHTCSFMAQHVRGNGRYLAAGRYADELRRTDAGWLFSSRVLVSTWAEGDPEVVRARP